jgi:hypothetical protein
VGLREDTQLFFVEMASDLDAIFGIVWGVSELAKLYLGNGATAKLVFIRWGDAIRQSSVGCQQCQPLVRAAAPTVREHFGSEFRTPLQRILLASGCIIPAPDTCFSSKELRFCRRGQPALAGDHSGYSKPVHTKPYGGTKMKTIRNRITLGIGILCLVVAVGLFAALAIAESSTPYEGIPPVPQEILADVISFEFDLLKVTSNWPKSLTVENISDMEVSGFEILIFAANDDGGPGEIIGWGQDPNYGKQPVLFKPQETMTLPIQPQTVKKFQDNGKSFLYLEQWRVWVNNDPQLMYSEGALLKQDEGKKGVYHVRRDAKGRDPKDRDAKRRRKHEHSHAMPPVPHITHSIKPPFPLGCCNREFLDSITFDCEVTDTCDPEQRKCQVTNNAYTICSYCCSDLTSTSYVSCHSVGSICPPYLCSQSKWVTHTRPCNCCGC